MGWQLVIMWLGFLAACCFIVWMIERDNDLWDD